MKLSKEIYLKYLGSNRAKFLVLFLVFFLALLVIGCFCRKTFKEMAWETPSFSVKALPKENIPFLFTGKVKSINDHSLTIETEKESINFTVSEETLFYPHQLPPSGKRIPLEGGLKSLKIGEEIKVLYKRIGNIFWANEIWL